MRRATQGVFAFVCWAVDDLAIALQLAGAGGYAGTHSARL